MGSSLILIAAALMGQTERMDLAQWVDKVVTATEHRQAHQSMRNLLGRPKSDAWYLEELGDFHVWRRGPTYVVLQEHPYSGRSMASRITVSTVDSSGRKVVATSHMVTGYCKKIKGVKRVDRPDLSDFVLRVDVGNFDEDDPIEKRNERRRMNASFPDATFAQEFYAFDGNRLALVYLGDVNQRPEPNDYWTPIHTVGPEVLAYTKAALLDILSIGSLTQRLEAMTWLTGKHQPLAAELDPDTVSMSTVIRFWTLDQDPDVRLVIARLTSSADPWVSAMAKKFAADWNPLPKSTKKAERITQSLKIEDLKVGEGTEFSGKDMVLSKGDRAVIEFEGKLPDGTVFETNYTSDYSPISIEAGDNSVIEGLSKGILGMRAGGTRKLTIPAELAFGPVGAGLIPPNGDVIYTVKLAHIHRGDYFGPPITRDVRSGNGPTAKVGSRVVYKWKAWLITGKSITAKMDNPATLDLVSEPYPSDIQKVLVGMQPGGIRRTLIREFHPFESSWFGFDKLIMEIEVLSVVDGPRG